MTKRELSEPEKNIWQRIAITVRPLNGPKPTKTAKRPDAAHMHLPPAPGPILHHTHRDIQTRKDKKTRRGHVHIERTIDLHDLTRDAAFAHLKIQIIRAYERQHRTVLIITGKGPNLRGVLRQSLPGWLTDPAIRPVIASFAQAHIRHGGTGAFYVFLKRR